MAQERTWDDGDDNDDDDDDDDDDDNDDDEYEYRGAMGYADDWFTMAAADNDEYDYSVQANMAHGIQKSTSTMGMILTNLKIDFDDGDDSVRISKFFKNRLRLRG